MVAIYHPVITFWINIGAVVIAVSGVLTSCYQLKQSRSASQAAENAANKSLKALQQNITSMDVPKIVKGLRDTTNMIEREEYKIARFVIAEQYHPDLVRLSKLEKFKEDKREHKMIKLKSKLTSVRDNLPVNKTGDINVDQFQIKVTLYEIADQLEEWVEEDRFTMEVGRNDT